MKLQLVCFVFLVSPIFGRPNTTPESIPVELTTTTPKPIVTTEKTIAPTSAPTSAPTTTTQKYTRTPTPTVKSTTLPPAISTTTRKQFQLSKTSSSTIKDDKRIHQEIADTIHKSMIEPVPVAAVEKSIVKSPEVKRPMTAAEQKKLNVPLYMRRSDDIVPVTVEKVEVKKVETTRPIIAPISLVRSSVVGPSSLLKSNDEKVDFPTTNGHRGIAVPMTMDEIEREMAAGPKQVVSNSTPKEGLSTWILLSGNGPTVQPEHGDQMEADKKMDKIARIKETQATVNQINKKKIEERIKNRQKLSTTTTSTTPASDLPEYAYDDEYENEDEVVEETETSKTTAAPTTTTTKQTTKKPNNNQNQKKKQTNVSHAVKSTTKKPKRTVTTTTAATPTTSEIYPLYETTQKQETTTFIVLEPKDAGFDLPQDRSPANANKKKRPNSNNKNSKNKNQKQKKKPANADGTKNSTKVAKPPKKKQNPMSTQIYNYLAREVMPTVGVGLVGLVVTAGLATYLLGSPLTALRRSYDIADRKDDLYQFNNEEYAGPDGQNEEEMFGKVIAGMPTSSLYRSNIRYPVAQTSAPTYRPNPNQIYQGPPQGYSSYGKYGPYNRYRYTAPAAGYRPVPPTTNNFPQYQPQPQPQSQYRYNSQGQAQTGISTSSAENPNVKTVYAQSMPSSYTSSQEESPIYTSSAEDSSAIMEQTKSTGYSVGSTIDNTLQRRTQFVVGSVVPDTPEPTEASKDQEEEIVESTSAAGVPEHGPRRRKRAAIRRAAVEKSKKSKTLDDNEIENENDIDGILHVRVTKAPGTNADVTDSQKDGETTTEYSYYETSTAYPGQGSPLVDFFRRILELKVKYGITFLKSATNAFQRYLSGVEERVEASPILNPQY